MNRLVGLFWGLYLLTLTCSYSHTALAIQKPKDFFKIMREQMVKEQIEARGIKNPAVLKAMRTVERHQFVDKPWQNQAYSDHPLPIGFDQTISQPFIVAHMTELVEPEPDHKILEVGTGSGYQAAILAKIVKEVYTIEIVKGLAEAAQKKLKKLAYENIHFKTGDGYAGWPEAAPFDGIIVTAAPDHLPQPLIDQLKVSGKLVIPVGPLHDVQMLKVYEKTPKGGLKEKNQYPVRFVPLTRKPK